MIVATVTAIEGDFSGTRFATLELNDEPGTPIHSAARRDANWPVRGVAGGDHSCSLPGDAKVGDQVPLDHVYAIYFNIAPDWQIVKRAKGVAGE